MCTASILSEELSGTLQKIKEEKENFGNIVHDCDLKTCDLLHELEINDIKGMYHAWKLITELKEVRKIRRNAKDELRTTTILHGYIASVNNCLTSANVKIEKEENDMKTRHYNPRTDCKFTAV